MVCNYANLDQASPIFTTKENISMKKLYFIFILLFTVRMCSAQYYYYDNDHLDNAAILEAGGSVGLINCLTDIGGRKGLGSKFVKDVNFGNTQINGSLYFGLLYKYKWGLRVEASRGSVSAADSVLKNYSGTESDPRLDRNVSFASDISTLTLIAEFYPTMVFETYDITKAAPLGAPYLLAGIGLFHFNPQTMYKGKLVDLQPLHTEGQGFPQLPNRKNYKLTQINIPIGLGFKYELSRNLNLRAEFIYYILNTDYLDDVSKTYVDPALFAKNLSGDQLQKAMDLNYRGYEIGKNHDHNPGAPRGSAKNNDAYFTFNVKVGYIFNRSKIKYDY